MQTCLKNTADKLLCGLDVVKVYQNHSNRYWGPSQTTTITSQTIRTNLFYFSALRVYWLLQGITECVYLVHQCSPRPEQHLAHNRHSITVYWKKNKATIRQSDITFSKDDDKKMRSFSIFLSMTLTLWSIYELLEVICVILGSINFISKKNTCKCIYTSNGKGSRIAPKIFNNK